MLSLNNKVFNNLKLENYVLLDYLITYMIVLSIFVPDYEFFIGLFIDSHGNLFVY